MKNETRDLIELLNNNEEDFEWYPTSKEMLNCIYRSIGTENNFSVIDVGCGRCDFKNNILEKQKISKYMVFEKSKTFINMLEKDTYILGTDFLQNTLIDKKADVLFCNPPYSLYKEFMIKIIKETNCKSNYLVVPERWKDDKDIIKLIEAENISFNVIGSFDFLNAERQARAKVDIVKIIKCYNNKENAFSEWFNEHFKIEDEDEDKFDWKKSLKQEENYENKIVCAENKIKMLLDMYDKELEKINYSFSNLATIDIEVLKSVGVYRNDILGSLKEKLESLKILYWKRLFNLLDDITDRLTIKSREDLHSKFTENNYVDFNYANIYAVVVWCIKNASDFYNKQLIDLFYEMSSFENVKKYKSNQNTFEKENWRWRNYDKEHKHYTLDYRLVLDRFVSFSYGGDFDKYQKDIFKDKINDFIVIGKNLGFDINKNFYCSSYSGEKNFIYFNGVGNDKKITDKDVFLEFKWFKNGNCHIKMNIEFCKALNVEASRLLGWIKNKEDISKEFDDKIFNNSEKYFEKNLCLSLNKANLLMIGE